MVSVTLPINIGQDPVKLIVEHGAKYVAWWSFELNLHQEIELGQLMVLLMGLYQQLENYNGLLHYTIIPQPLSAVKCDRYSSVALGGTFDYLHAGHLLLLTYSRLLLEEGGQLIVGVTGQAMLVHKQNRQFLQSLATRQFRVRQFLEKLSTAKPRVFELTDPYGPTITQAGVQAMVVTKQTEAAGPKINQLRETAGLQPLKIYVMDLISDVSSNTKVSSSIIRKHLSDKNGFTGQMRIRYREYWREACRVIQAAADKEHSTALAAELKIEEEYLFERYSEPWRHYHTNRHILTMLEEYKKDEVYHQQKRTAEEQAALLLSIFYHDVVYQPELKDNEEQSATLLDSFISRVQKYCSSSLEGISSRARQLILMTKQHSPKCHLEAILNDLDMAVLASPLPQYQLYAQNIKQQYLRQFSSPSEFNTLRAKFLKGLDTTHVFHLHPHWGQLCHRNIQFELKSLLGQESDL